MSVSNQEMNDEESLLEPQINKEDSSKTSPIPTKSATTPEIPDFGWSAYAERMNGRFAMIGLSAVLIIEFLSNQTFLKWAGLIN